MRPYFFFSNHIIDLLVSGGAIVEGEETVGGIAAEGISHTNGLDKEQESWFNTVVSSQARQKPDPPLMR